MAVALVLGLTAGGCSLSYQLDSFLAKNDDSAADRTGSIGAQAQAKAVSEMPPDADLVYARAAAADVVGRSSGDTSLPWANPQSGARGTVTAIAMAYSQDGFTCRDFLASYVNGRSESWLQGEACRAGKGKWDVRSLKPWKRS